MKPTDRHNGKGTMIMERCHKVHEEARKRYSERWTKQTRDWEFA